MKHEIDLPDLPDGFEYTGEWRKAKKGDCILASKFNDNGGRGFEPVECGGDRLSPHDKLEFILRRPKPAPLTRIDQIKAKYAEYRVVEIRLNSYDRYVIDDENQPFHVEAQSMKGFYEYVYENEDGSFFDHPRPIIYRANDKVIHPVAVLFSK